MRITYDPTKNEKNIAERGLSFDRVLDLQWETALMFEDRRRDYGEVRVHVLAMLGNRLHAVVVTARADAVHVISFRKASEKEMRRYEKEISTSGRAGRR